MSHWHPDYWAVSPLATVESEPDLTIGLRAYLIADEIPYPIQYSKIDETVEPPYIWYNRKAHEKVLGSGGMTISETTEFDLEVWSDDLSICQMIAAQIKDVLHGYRGMMGLTRVLQCQCLDHEDDYLPQGSKDDGLFFASLWIKFDH